MNNDENMKDGILENPEGDVPVYSDAVQQNTGNAKDDTENFAHETEQSNVNVSAETNIYRSLSTEAPMNGEPAGSEREQHDAIASRKAEISRLQEEIRREEELKKAQMKKEKKENRKRGVPFWGCILIAVIFTVIGCASTILILMKVPIPFSEDSFIGEIVSSYSESVVKNKNSNIVAGEDTTVGGTVVSAGSDVTINVETNEVASAVYAKANQSVVGIRVVASTANMPWAQATYAVVGEGSGIVYSEDGLIVTNYHVIADALSDGTLVSGNEIRVFLDSSLTEYHTAELKGYDTTSDLAVLKIDVNGLTPLELADSDTIEIGETAIAIGSPGGLEFMNSVSAGIISGLNRNLSTDDGIAYNLLQTTAAINPGNSGGALLNSEGQLIGICVMKLVSDGYEGMGFAIASNTVDDIVSDIVDNGSVVRPQLGVTINTTYTATEAKNYNMPVGAWVYSIAEDSAADKAGIKINDIIVSFDGVEIADFYGLRTELLKHSPGDTVEVKVYRDGEYMTLEVVLDYE